MDNRKELGRIGENLAKNYLIENGYLIKHQNITFGHKEIDIVAKIGKEVVFVEVKTRTSFVFGGADTALTSRQIKTLKKAINLYAYNYGISKDFVRLDLISIDINKTKKVANLSHFKDVI